MEVSEAQMRVDELAKLHAELKASVTAVATPTVSATAILEPTATIGAPPFVPVTPEPAMTATSVVAEVTPEEAEQEETADQPVLKSTPFHVQVGVYTKKANLLKVEKVIHKAGYKYYVVTAKKEDQAYTLYKVRVGYFATRSAAQKVATILVKKTKEKAIVVED
jgi:cell division septation protein DedD